MVLISLHPFAFRKIFLLALALLGFSSAFCFADPLFMTQHYGSPESHRHQPLVAERQTGSESSLLRRTLDSSQVTRAGEIRRINFAEIAPNQVLVPVKDQILPASILAPFDKTPAGFQPNNGLIFGLAAPQSSELSHL